MTTIVPGLAKVKHIIAVASGKGGVGKSTVTTNLAHALKRQGFKVGLLDGDIYGPSQASMMGKKDGPKAEGNFVHPIENNGIKFISMASMNPGGGALILRAPMAIKAVSQLIGGVIWGELDYLLIDLPPGTGDIQLTLAQQARLSAAIIVTTPQKVAVDIAKKGLEMFQTLNVPILGVIENMSGFVCSHCNEETEIFKQGGGKQLANLMDLRFLGAIPLDPRIVMNSDEGTSIIEEDPKSKVAQAFISLADSVVKNIEGLQNQANLIEPSQIRIFEDSGVMEVKWNDGATIKYNPYKLRLECPCASCVDENTGKKLISPEKVSMDIKVNAARGVGRYGLALTFSDSHSTGIFKFTKLRAMTGETEQELSL
jgi:ATP-binding protein involved in chromosome partitioning